MWERDCCPTHLCIHCLIFVCALTRDWSQTLVFRDDTLTHWTTQPGPKPAFLITVPYCLGTALFRTIRSTLVLTGHVFFVKGKLSVPFLILSLKKSVVLLVFLPEVVELGDDLKKHSARTFRSFCFVVMSNHLTRLRVNLEYFLLPARYLAFHTPKAHLMLSACLYTYLYFSYIFSIDLGVLLFGLPLDHHKLNKFLTVKSLSKWVFKNVKFDCCIDIFVGDWIQRNTVCFSSLPGL